MEKEIWKQTKYPNYLVSSLGNVRHVKKDKNRKLNDNGLGYKTVGFIIDGKLKNFLVHRLVMEAFVENVDNLPEVNHKNLKRDDNRLENLEYISRMDNMIHALLMRRNQAA